MDKQFLIFIFLCVLVLAGVWHFTGNIPEPTYTELNEEFKVKELHLGHANGEDFIMVLYYDEGKIMTVNNEGNRNIIDMYNTNESAPYLILNYVGNEANKYGYTVNIYSLYIPENTSFCGTETQYTVPSGKSSREVTAIVY